MPETLLKKKGTKVAPREGKQIQKNRDKSSKKNRAKILPKQESKGGLKKVGTQSVNSGRKPTDDQPETQPTGSAYKVDETESLYDVVSKGKKKRLQKIKRMGCPKGCQKIKSNTVTSKDSVQTKSGKITAQTSRSRPKPIAKFPPKEGLVLVIQPKGGTVQTAVSFDGTLQLIT